MRKKIFYLWPIFCFVFLFWGTAALGATTLKLTNTALDTVKVEATGKASTSVRLSFLPTGASALTTVTLGTTDTNGSLVTSISSGGYGIPANSPVYATIDGVQSTTMLWPSYASTLALSKTSTQIAVGQNTKITSTNTLILASNSLPASIGTALSGSQLTVTGLGSGTGTLVLCGTNAGCVSVTVIVGSGTGQTEITLSENSRTLNYRESAVVSIFGGGNNGYTIVSNTNASAVNATISGSSNEIALYANSAGSATIKVCSVESDTNCATLYVTALAASANSLSFSQNNFSLAPSVAQTVTVSGGPDDNYYISSNSSTGVATASLYGNQVTVTGGSITGSTVITICSASKSSVCSGLSVNNNAEVATPSASVLAFSQNVVSVAKDETSNVTVSGGNGNGYSVTSNSKPNIATASVGGGNNIIAVHGNEEGTTIIEVCSVETTRVCASIYVIVGPEVKEISFSKSPVALIGQGSAIVTITGGTTKNIIYSISDPAVVAASLSNNGQTLVLNPGTKNGTALVKICDEIDNTDNCASLTVTLSGAAETISSSSKTTETSTPTNTPTPQLLSEATVVYAGGIDGILTEMSAVRNGSKETTILSKYVNSLKADQKTLGSDQIDRLTFFVTYGTKSTKALGEGERAGVLGSYKKAFKKLPTTEAEWADVIKIANGRWPAETSQTALDAAKVEFRKVYLREPVMTNTYDNAAVSVIAYGLRPSARKTEAEKVAIKTFKYIYGHNPSSSLAWDIVRAIAYSGAKR